MNQFATPEAFAAANKASLETAQNLLNNAKSRAERLVALNMNIARSVLEDSAASVQTLLAIKDPKDLGKLQTELAQPAVDKFVEYSRNVYEIAAEGQQELSKLVEAHIAEVNKAVAAALEQAEKSAPAGSEQLFAGVKQAIAAANSAYGEFSKLVAQATEAMESNVAAAKKASVPAVKKSSKKDEA